MSYRNPRFCYKHMLRDYKALGIDPNTDTPATGSTTSLYDDRHKGPLVTWPGASNEEVIAYKNAAATAEGQRLSGGRLNRVIIPAGHSLIHQVPLRIRMSDDLIEGNSDLVDLVDGVKYYSFVSSSGMIDVELHPSESRTTASLLEIRMRLSLTAANYGITELWWTDTVSPTTGIAHGWDATDDAVFDRIESRSGAAYRQKRGPKKRRWVHRHRHLSGADLKLYDDMRIGTGYGLHPFWYEHPDSGDVETLIEDWADAGSFTTTNSSTATLTAGRADGESGNFMRHEAGSNVNIEWSYPVASTLAPDADWSNKILRVQMKGDWDSSAITDVQFFVESVVGAQTARTNYDIGGAFTEFNVNDWWRVEIDLDLDATDFTGSGPADLSSPSNFGFIVNRDTTGRQTDFGDMILIDKDKQPVLVEAVNYERGQDGGSPSGSLGPTFQIAMGLLEVTS